MLKLSIALYVIRAVMVEQNGDILFESTELRVASDERSILYTIRSFMSTSENQRILFIPRDA